MLLTGGATPFDVVLGDLIPFGYRLACGMLHDAAAAEDAVQEAALKAWRKRSRLRPGADPLPWFLAIVANECRSMRRQRWWSVLVAPSRRPRRGRVASLSLIGGAVVVLLAVLAVVGLGLLAGAPASTPPPRPAALVITKWVKDPSVVNGPWPGYRPQMVLAYRGTLASVRAAKDPGGGNDWVLEFTLDPEGTQVLGSVTKEAVVACSVLTVPSDTSVTG